MIKIKMLFCVSVREKIFTLYICKYCIFSNFSEDFIFLNNVKETKSATMNIFRFFFYFLLKSLVKEELSSVFTINLFTIAENCTEKLIIL